MKLSSFPILQPSSCKRDMEEKNQEKSHILQFFCLLFCLLIYEGFHNVTLTTSYWLKFCSVRANHYVGMVTFDANMVPVPLHILVSLELN